MKKIELPASLKKISIRMDLVTAWVVGIIVAFILTLCVTAYAGTIFFDFLGSDRAPEAPAGELTISRSELLEALSTFSEREREFERLKAAPPALPDPAL